MAIKRKTPEEQTDSFLKGLFSHRYLLAHVLKSFVREFMALDVQTIARDCILPRGTSERIQTDNTDYGGGVRFDVVFHALKPDAKDEFDQITVNLEFQNNLSPGYEIIKRGIYYMASLLVEEKGKLFKGDDYGGLRKVTSIWLFPNSPRRLANSVCRYGLAERLCEGREESLARRGEIYDLLELKTVYLNQAREPEEGTGLHLLHTLFSGSLSHEERAEILERNYSIVFTQEEKKMFDMFRFAEERGLENGLEKGRALGLSEGKEIGLLEGKEIGLSKGKEIGLSEGKEIGLSEGEKIGLSKGHKEELDKNITSMIAFQLAENVSARDIIRMLTNVFKISVDEAQQRLKAVSAAMI